MLLPNPKTIIEPFKIKSIESIPFLSYSERLEWLEKAKFNLFNIPARAVTFDLLTDSGTSAMSNRQWAALMLGDESYAGAESFYNFENAIKEVTGFTNIIPTHQGRSAEALLMSSILNPNDIVIGNTHFDTTRANIEARGGIAIDMPTSSIYDSENSDPFKGNIDIEKLSKFLELNYKKVAAIILTVTNNSIGGQPVSLKNIEETSLLAKKYGIKFFLDAARFAENSYFIKIREEKYKNWSINEIAKKMFSYADGTLMSAKKDTFSNIGGFIALNDQNLTNKIRSMMVITEGFPTYGGLAGRDLEVIAVGIKEILNEKYLSYRIRTIEYFGERVEKAGYKVIKPFGGHALYIDALKTLPHIPWYEFPGQSLSVAFYEHIGIRSVEIGSVMLGGIDENGKEKKAPMELVRLAFPRRVYTQSHVDFMIEMMTYLSEHLHTLGGYEITYQPKYLRHFTAHFKRLT